MIRTIKRPRFRLSPPKGPLFLIICIFALASILPSPAHSQFSKNQKYYRWSIKKLITFEQYGDAELAVDSLIAAQENSGWGYLYRATLRLTQMVDFGDTLYAGSFHQDINIAQDLFSNALAATNSLDTLAMADHYFALASLSALQAQFYNEVEGKPLKAYPFLKEAKNYFNLTLENYSDFDEAKTALAIFEFWQSQVMRFITWLPLVKDNRQTSLAYLTHQSEALDENEVSTAISLMWILIEQESPAEALRVGEELKAQYGPLRSILEPCGKAAFLLNDYEKTKNYYTQLIRSLEKQPRLNKTRIIGALNRLATIANLQKDYHAVVFYADAALSFDLNKEQAEKKGKDLKRLVRFRKEAIKAMEN